MGAVHFRGAAYIRMHQIKPDTRAGQAPKKDTIMNIAKKLTSWRKYRETVTELGRMTDRELSDLGIGRADIRRVARTAVGF